ncbi:hypothetical protein IUY40_19170, partial [Flavobacterium sp. ALJ2]|uniref:Calx-beta domain-containing protein n=1 Tax=Flavobacterium sp. ALJ2 TaxID=2786960 RepID=UPI001E30A02C
ITAGSLTGFSWDGAAKKATVTITDVTDPLKKVLRFSPTTANVAEGSSTSINVSLPAGVTLGYPLTVNYSVSGTATKGTDYSALSGSVTIPAGSEGTITVAALSDTIIESDETVIITGSTTTGFIWDDLANRATVTITDVTDPANKVLSISPATASIKEGESAILTVSLPRGVSTGTDFVVNYTLSGTATNGTDYTALSGKVTIAAGQISAVINIEALKDGVIEPNETVLITGAATAGFTWDAAAKEALVTII